MSMDKTADFEIWRQIPPEEKLAIMSRAQGNGAFTALITIVIFSTVAVGLKMPWLLWTSLLISPLMYQLAAGKAWRALRPRIMLEYLAARSAARRYAFSANSNDLGVSLIFRGQLSQVYDNPALDMAMESMMKISQEASVWVALFNDALVMISERKGGATCEFAALTNEKLIVNVKNDDDEDYTNAKEIFLTQLPEKGRAQRKFRVTSKYPAALVVFEKKLLKAIETTKAAKEKELQSFKEETAELDEY